MPPRSLMVVAGEVSGDLLAAELVRALKARDADLSFFGVGGDALRAEGVEIVQDIAPLAVVGISEALARLPFFFLLMRRLTDLVRQRRPAAVILVDFPGFNIRLAERLHRLGVPVIYYVCPQVWAWHRGRVRILARSVNRLLALFPFEKELLAGTGLAIEFVGHPLVGPALAQRRTPPEPLPWQGAVRLALLPGSRRHEIDRHLPPMLEAAALLEKREPDLSCLIATPSTASAPDMERRLSAWTGPRPSRLAVVGGLTREVLKQARAAAVASGTATLETALMRCPMIIVYRTAALTYALARVLVRVPFIGMVNLIAGQAVCPELIQHDLTAQRLAEKLRPLLRDSPERAAMLDGLDETVRRLGGSDGAARAAVAVLEVLAARPR